MIVSEATVTIQRPRDEVFRFVSDHRNEPRWHTDVVEVRDERGDGVGSQMTWIVRFMGRKPMRMEIVAFEAGRREVLQARSGPMLPTLEYRVEDDGAGARFTRRVEIRPRGLMGAMAPMMKQMVAKRNRRFVGNLKEVLES